MNHGAISLSSYWRLVRVNPNFRRLWLAQIISEMGDWLYTIAIYSLLLEVTGSAQSVAVAVVLQILPQFFVAPTAGVINDRMSRKQVMIFADVARAVIVLCMLPAAGAGMVAPIYVLLLLATLMWALFEPGRTAIVPNITEGGDLVVANALSSMTWSLNLAVGSALGGVLAALFGRGTVFVLNSLSFLVSAALLARIRVPEPHLDHAAPLKARDLVDFSPMAEGMNYVRRDRRLLATLLVKAGLGLMATHWVLLPIFGERIFPVRATGLDARDAGMLGMSLLMGSRGIGALLGPVLGGYWTGQRRARLRMSIVFGFVAGALGYLGLAAAPSIAVACAAIILAHAGASVVWVSSTTLLQFQTEDRFRGRVFSADFAFLVLTGSIASFAAGTLLDWGVAVRTLSAATGLAALLPAVAWAFSLRLWKTTPTPPQPL